MKDWEISERAKEKANKYNTNKPLSSNIAGKYVYNSQQQRYYYSGKKQPNTEKNIYAITIGKYKPVVFINHTDYSVEQSEYYTTQIDGKRFYVFSYNNTEYIIPQYYTSKEKVIVEKYKNNNTKKNSSTDEKI